MAVTTTLLMCSMLHLATALVQSTRLYAFKRSSRSLHRSTKAGYGYPQKSPALFLNRILFDASEIDDDSSSSHGSEYMATVTLPKSDYRTIHIAKILRLKNGDVVRAGSVINSDDDAFTNCTASDHTHSNTNHTSSSNLQGLLTDEASIQWLPEGKIKKTEPTKTGDPPGSLRLCIPHPPKTTLLHSSSTTAATTTPPVSLLLAVPRPLQLQRILPAISQCGVDTLLLTHASKVPRDYFGSHLFRKPHIMRDLLIEGLTLSGMDLKVPRLLVNKRPVKELLGDESFERMFPREEWVRVIAHPERRKRVVDHEDVIQDNGCDNVVRMTDLDFPMDGIGKHRRILVAVGPEGGWEEPNELDLFEQHGFQKVTLGTRVLRSDVAVVSLLALANEVCSKEVVSAPAANDR